jgi:hypothetical protein
MASVCFRQWCMCLCVCVGGGGAGGRAGRAAKRGLQQLRELREEAEKLPTDVLVLLVSRRFCTASAVIAVSEPGVCITTFAFIQLHARGKGELVMQASCVNQQTTTYTSGPLSSTLVTPSLYPPPPPTPVLSLPCGCKPLGGPSLPPCQPILGPHHTIYCHPPSPRPLCHISLQAGLAVSAALVPAQPSSSWAPITTSIVSPPPCRIAVPSLQAGLAVSAAAPYTTPSPPPTS